MSWQISFICWDPGSSIWTTLNASGSSIWTAIKASGSSIWRAIKASGSSICTALKASGSLIWRALKASGSLICISHYNSTLLLLLEIKLRNLTCEKRYERKVTTFFTEEPKGQLKMHCFEYLRQIYWRFGRYWWWWCDNDDNDDDMGIKLSYEITSLNWQLQNKTKWNYSMSIIVIFTLKNENIDVKL